MKIKNIRKVSDSEYVCEIQHPEYGWIPYTALEGTGEPEMEEIWDKITSSNKTYKIDFGVVKERSRANLLNQVSGLVNRMKAPYSPDERELWTTKRVEAEKVVAGEKSILLEVEASISEESPEEIAHKIIRKNNEYNVAVVTAESLKKNINKDYDKVKTLSEVDSLNSKYTGIIKKLVTTP